MRELVIEYEKRKRRIRQRLREFKAVWQQPDAEIFSELCFCICTPQSKAVYCDKAVSSLKNNGTLFKGSLRQIKAGLRSVRFPNNKAGYIVEAREQFTVNGTLKIKDKINKSRVPETRLWLADNVKGIGLKEASHFLRNIGLGKDLAILDVHILNNMVNYRIIRESPAYISKTGYLLLENELRKFSRKINIPMDELDLLLWSMETGKVFK